MGPNDQRAIENFKSIFGGYSDKRIAIYGIGRMTATLVQAVPEFNIVGLMDRDEENLGKEMYGFTVIDLKTAEERADIIIINAPQTYWKTIFSRISNSKIPVFYKDGTRAVNEEKEYKKNDYWKFSLDDILLKIHSYDAISFDLYDTLVMRNTYLPQDIWTKVQSDINFENIECPNFVELRKLAVETKEYAPDIYDIYKEFARNSNLPGTLVDKIMHMELEREEQSIILRTDMIKVYELAKKLGKEIYIVSDMHLPADVLKDIIGKKGIDVDADKLYISSDKKATKADGTLWEMFRKDVGDDKKVLHIGDNLRGDIDMPKRYNIDTLYIMSAADMLSNSALIKTTPMICSKYASYVVGVIISKLLNSPFALCEKRGELMIKDAMTLGYCVFGPVVYTYLSWIRNMVKERGFDKIFFFGRDGYFLQKDYSYMCELTKENAEFDYIEISRRAAMVANIKDEQDFMNVIKVPYMGSYTEFMQDRFGIQTDERTQDINSQFVSTSQDYDSVYEWCKLYKKELKEEIVSERKCYIKYLKTKGITERSCIVDLFFNGSTQYYVSKLLDMHLTGLYVVCNMSQENHYRENNTLISCFQKEQDFCGEDCMIYKNCWLLESFLTAPTGMLLRVDENQKFIHAKPGKNQEDFGFREDINEGVKNFIYDIEKSNMGQEIRLDAQFIDTYYGDVYENALNVSEHIKERFYADNALVYRRELRILE